MIQRDGDLYLDSADNHRISRSQQTSPEYQHASTLAQYTESINHTTPSHATTGLRPFFRDHPGQPVPEENFWTLWCKGRLTEADTLTIRLGATPSGLTSAHVHYPPINNEKIRLKTKLEFSDLQQESNSTVQPIESSSWSSAHEIQLMLTTVCAFINSTSIYLMTYHHTTTTTVYGRFSGTTRVSRCQKRTSGLYGARED